MALCSPGPPSTLFPTLLRIPSTLLHAGFDHRLQYWGRSQHLNVQFERKCAGGLPGQFAGTFAGHYLCLEHLIVVILLRATLIRVNLRLHQLVPRGEPEYLSVLFMPFALPRT